MKFKRCPLCDSPKIKQRKGPYDFMIKGEKITTPAVSYWACPNCGEAFFDREANQIIDKALLPTKRRATKPRVLERV